MEIVQQNNVVSQYQSQADVAITRPRNIKKFIENCIATVTMDIETAESCGYSLPRAKKIFRGASVHLAKIMAGLYGNLRIQESRIEVSEKEVTAYAICYDSETNTVYEASASRSIIGKNGRYSDDMIIINGRAIMSIAVRNAIFNVIPQAITDKVYKESQKMLVGDLSNETKLIKARKKALEVFESDFGVTEAELLKSIGLNTTNQIKADQIVVLREMLRDLKEGVQTVDEMFQRNVKAMDKPKVNIKESKTDAKLPELNQNSENWDSIVELLSQTQLTPDQVKQKFTITDENIELLIEMAMEKSEM